MSNSIFFPHIHADIGCPPNSANRNMGFSSKNSSNVLLNHHGTCFDERSNESVLDMKIDFWHPQTKEDKYNTISEVEDQQRLLSSCSSPSSSSLQGGHTSPFFSNYVLNGHEDQSKTDESSKDGGQHVDKWLLVSDLSSHLAKVEDNDSNQSRVSQTQQYHQINASLALSSSASAPIYLPIQPVPVSLLPKPKDNKTTSSLPINLSMKRPEDPNNSSTLGSNSERTQEVSSVKFRSIDPSYRKRRKQMLVPATNKDERYWTRRLKNNEAAKRSRDMRIRREKVVFDENSRLENGLFRLSSERDRLITETKELQFKMDLIMEDNARLKQLLTLYERRYPELSSYQLSLRNNLNSEISRSSEGPSSSSDTSI